MIAFAEVPIGSGGTVACAACGATSDFALAPAESVLARVHTEVASWSAGPGPNIAFIGAEPFAHHELPSLVAAAVEAGVLRLRLRTDAGALSVPGNAAGAIAAGVRHLEVVLLGGDASTHDSLSGRPGLFADAIGGVSAFLGEAAKQGASAAVAGLVPVCRHNLAHAAATVAAFARAGAVAVTLDVAPSAADALGSDDWIAAAIETGTVNGVWVCVHSHAEKRVPVSALHLLAPATTVGVA